jgi:hypothetical protein
VDENLTREAGRGKQSPKLGMCPRHRPNGSVVTFDGLRETLLFPFNVKDADGLVGGAGGKTATVVIELGVVLEAKVSVKNE